MLSILKEVELCNVFCLWYLRNGNVIIKFLFLWLQEAESVASQALQNVVMLTDLISSTLVVDGNESANFTNYGKSISKYKLIN